MMTWLCRFVARCADWIWHNKQTYVSGSWVLDQRRNGREE